MPLPAGVRVRTIEGNNKQAEEKAAPGQISGII
jgi:hypothetical protein